MFVPGSSHSEVSYSLRHRDLIAKARIGEAAVGADLSAPSYSAIWAVGWSHTVARHPLWEHTNRRCSVSSSVVGSMGYSVLGRPILDRLTPVYPHRSIAQARKRARISRTSSPRSSSSKAGNCRASNQSLFLCPGASGADIPAQSSRQCDVETGFGVAPVCSARPDMLHCPRNRWR